MRLVSYVHQGQASFGLVSEQGVTDLRKLSLGRFASLRAALAADALAALARKAATLPCDFSLDYIRFLPVIPEPQKIFCVGLNYEEHRLEANRPKTGEPTIFLRTPTSQVGHLEPLVLPAESASLDYEGEIAIVIAGPDATSKNRMPGIISPDTRPTTTARSVTGRPIPRSGPVARISMALAPSVHGS